MAAIAVGTLYLSILSGYFHIEQGLINSFNAWRKLQLTYIAYNSVNWQR